LIGIMDQNGRGQIWKDSMSPQELADYRAHKDSYFGRILAVGGKIDDPFELFEWFVGNHKWMSRAQLLERLAEHPLHFRPAEACGKERPEQSDS
jgi:hypothetical protein